MNNNKNIDQIFDLFSKEGAVIAPEHRQSITDRINRDLNYVPKIGFFGKTGAGKSSLCNALFGQAICPVSDVDPCTRQTQELNIGVGDKKIVLLDVPGVGESRDRDEEYAKLYRDLLPQLDLVIWVLKGDDRAFSSDQTFYQTLVKPHMEQGKPFVIAINQVDKIEPFREWNVEQHQPGATQLERIQQKRSSVAGFFAIALDRVIPVSANEQYGLVELLDKMIHELPNDKKITVLKQAQQEYRSERSKEEAERGWWEHIIDVVDLVSPVKVGPIIKAAKAVFSSVRSFFSSWW